MNNEKTGQFISELRKSRNMTQKELASKLNVTDKAVSKWERGLSYPDISLLPDLADILAVTVSELLNGEKSKENTAADVEAGVDTALKYADKAVRNRTKSIQNICTLAFSALMLTGLAVCAVCDLAITGEFTWSLFPISSIIFGWLVFFPVFKFGMKGIWGSMAALSFLIIPFLYVLNSLIKTSPLLLPVGIRTAVVSVIFLWFVFALFRFLRTRKLVAAAISLLAAIPLSLLINLILSRIISEPIVDVWDILTFCIIIAAAGVLFAIDYNAGRKSGAKQ